MDEFERAMGALLGVFVGDALGEQVRGVLEEAVKAEFPEGLMEMYSKERAQGDTGEITEEGALTILLANSIIQNERFDIDHIKATYRAWNKEEPELMDASLATALQETPSAKSDSALSLVRLVPLAIYGAQRSERELLKNAEAECSLTHANQLCLDGGRILALAIARLVSEELTADELLTYLKITSAKLKLDERVQKAIELGGKRPPALKGDSVPIALQLCIHTLLNSSSFEEGMVRVASKGGDAAGINASLYGALAGALYGAEAIPERWVGELQVSEGLERYLKKQSRFRRLNMNLSLMAHDLAEKLLKL
jgi:ADP-ribosyl-[dinitrogen reductase] hydrolase